MDIDTARHGRVRPPWPVATAAAILLIFEAVWAYSGAYLVAHSWNWWNGPVYERLYGEFFLNLGMGLLAVALVYFALTVAVIRGRRRVRTALIVPTVTLAAFGVYVASSIGDPWPASAPLILFSLSPLLSLVAVGLLHLPSARPYFARCRAGTSTGRPSAHP